MGFLKIKELAWLRGSSVVEFGAPERAKREEPFGVLVMSSTFSRGLSLSKFFLHLHILVGFGCFLSPFLIFKFLIFTLFGLFWWSLYLGSIQDLRFLFLVESLFWVNSRSTFFFLGQINIFFLYVVMDLSQIKLIFLFVQFELRIKMHYI